MRSHITTSDTQHSRAGFSLVEMLVVMAIIALLSTLSFVVLGKSGEIAREASTKAMMKILSGAVRERVDALNEITPNAFLADPELPALKSSRIFRTNVDDFTAKYAAAPGNITPISRVQAEVFVRKLMFKSMFPQRRADLYGEDGVPQEDNGIANDSPLLNRMYSGIPAIGTRKPTSWVSRNLGGLSMTSSTYTTPKDDPKTESSELLYLALTEGDVFGLPPAEIDGIDDNMIGDTDGDGNLEFLDGWGQPLQFYNWPTRLLKDDGVNYWGTLVFPPPPATMVREYPTASLLISNLPIPPVKDASLLPQRRPIAGSIASHRMYRDPLDINRSITRWNVYAVPYTSAGSPLASDFFLKPAAAAQYTAMGMNSAWFHDLNTPSMPLVVSAGSDGELGLHLPTEDGRSGTSHTDRLARVIGTEEACQALGDNITNQQRGPQ